MADKTGISWTDATWNVTTGCDRVSPGCGDATGGGCYAERLALRLQHTPAYEGTATKDGWTGKVNLVPERLDQPLRWKRPRRVFVDSMSDLFHEQVGSAFIGSVFDTMRRCPQHTFQILTKRTRRMATLMRGGVPGDSSPLPNVWLGTSIESDRYTFRADHLRETPAAVRFLSLEPLLGPLPSLDLTGIDWVIVGAESGRGARPMDEGWVRDLRDQAQDAGTAFFYKQSALPNGRKQSLPLLDGRQWTEMPDTKRGSLDSVQP